MQDTYATGYRSRNVDLTFVVSFYLCGFVVIFVFHNSTLGFDSVVMHL